MTGQVLQRANAPKAGAVPWLLLKAASNDGSGVFGRVTYIQRRETDGGSAPGTGCDSAHTGAVAAVNYQAEYVFYARSL